jgi:hypothetical protein
MSSFNQKAFGSYPCDVVAFEQKRECLTFLDQALSMEQRAFSYVIVPELESVSPCNGASAALILFYNLLTQEITHET